MKRRKRKEPYILWKPAEEQEDSLDRLQRFVWNWLAVTIVLLTAFSMLHNIIPEVTVSVSVILLTELELLLLMLITEFGIPYAEKHFFPRFQRKQPGTDAAKNRNGRRNKKAAVIEWILALLILALLGLIFRKYYIGNQQHLEKGIRCILQPYTEKFNKIYKTGIYYNEGRARYADMTVGFWSMLIVPIVYIAARLLKKMWFILILPAAVFIAGMLINISPDWGSLILFAVSLYMLNTSAAGKTVTGFTMTAKGRRSGSLHRYFTLIIGALMLILIGLTAEGLSETLISHNKEFLKFQKKAEAALGNFWYSNTETVSNASPRYSDKTVMTIEASGPVGGNLYLKDFYAETYTDGHWSVRTENFTDACKKNDINVTEMQNLLMNCMPDICSENNIITYSIDYGSFSGRAFPIPYISDVSSIGGISAEGDVLLKKGMFRSSVTLNAANNNTTTICEYLIKQQSYSEQSLDDAALWEWYNSYVLNAYTDIPSTVPCLSRTASGIMLSVPNCNNILQYGTAYQKAVIRLLLASEVSDYLSVLCIYSQNLEELPNDTDVVEYFLTEGHAGYCMHFASAGVLLLREMGIPARYASGYIAKQGAFEEQADGSWLCEITDRNAHAWVEIYLDNIGWVPVEMTPGYSGSAAELPTEEEPTEPTPTSFAPTESVPTNTPTPTSFAPTDTPTPTVNSEEPTPTQGIGATDTPTPTISGTENAPGNLPGSGEGQGGGTGTSGEDIFKTLTKIIAVVFCLAAVCGIAFLLTKKAVVSYNEYIYGELRHRRYKTAVKRINRRLYKKLRHGGKIRSRNITDEEYEELLVNLYPEIGAKDWHMYMDIVKKAAYSREEIAKEEAELVLGMFLKAGKKKASY